MDDVTLTQLFSRMDAHLERQDVELRVITQTLQQQGALLASIGQVLGQVAQQQTTAYTEMTRVLTALTRILDAHLRQHDGGAPS
jgi:hypothetical protein